jgi:hypothetical protein
MLASQKTSIASVMFGRWDNNNVRFPKRRFLDRERKPNSHLKKIDEADMIGCESAPVEGTVNYQGRPQGLEGEMGLLPGWTCSRFIRGDESGIGLFGVISRKRIEGGTPRSSQVAGDGCMTSPLLQRCSSVQRVRVPLLCSWDTQN